MERRKQRIGLVIDYLASEYSENLINGAASYCNEKDVDLVVFIIGEIHNPSIKTHNYQYVATTAQIRQANVDGIIIASGTQMHGTTKNELISYLHSYKPLPIVNISMVLKGIPSIVTDCNQAFDSLIQYLIDEQQCRHFGFMGVDSNSSDVKTRTSIFKEVLKRNNISLNDTTFWKSNFDYDSSYKLLEEYYAKNNSFPFDAIVASNDDTAFACMDFCQQRLNLRIPEDIVITGFDDLRRASFSNPPLTSVNQQVSYQAYKASQTLCSILNGQQVPLVQEIKAKAILRHSTDRVKNDQKPFISNDYIETEIISEDSYNRYSVSEWYNKRSQLFSAARFYTGMQHNVSTNEIGTVLTKEIKQFGFKAAAVVIYDNPIEVLYPFEYFNLPAKARVISAFDNSTGYELSKALTLPETFIPFNPNDYMIPHGILKFTKQGFFVTALYHNEIQFGYLIINRGDYDLGVYDLIAKAIANQLAASFSYTHIKNEASLITDKYNKLDIIANTDELTELKNRRGFMDMGNAVMKFAQAINQKGLVIYCDMDGLKKINDTYGHEAGDVAIKAQGTILRNNFRSTDIVARLAGDEFAIISPGLSIDYFNEIRENINKDCAKWSENSPYELSISMGFVEYPCEQTGYSLNSLLSDADASLYIEKGRKKAEKANEQKGKKTR